MSRTQGQEITYAGQTSRFRILEDVYFKVPNLQQAEKITCFQNRNSGFFILFIILSFKVVLKTLISFLEPITDSKCSLTWPAISFSHDAYTRLILYSTQHKEQQTDTALSQTHNFIKISLLFLKDS